MSHILSIVNLSGDINPEYGIQTTRAVMTIFNCMEHTLQDET